MSLQTIINSAESIAINRRRLIGQQFTRNQIVRVSEIPTRNPWRFDVTVNKLWRYEQVRALLEELDRMDRTEPQTITFSNNTNLSYMFAYQGMATSTQLAALQVKTFVGKTLTVKNLTDFPVGYTLFSKGDYVQIANKPYPFTVTQTVTRTSALIDELELPVHRANFFSDSVVDSALVVGNNVSFNVLCTNMPVPTLIPGGSTALVRFNDVFNLYEFTGLE